jgi:hypothetical protein
MRVRDASGKAEDLHDPQRIRDAVESGAVPDEPAPTSDRALPRSQRDRMLRRRELEHGR